MHPAAAGHRSFCRWSKKSISAGNHPAVRHILMIKKNVLLQPLVRYSAMVRNLLYSQRSIPQHFHCLSILLHRCRLQTTVPIASNISKPFSHCISFGDNVREMPLELIPQALRIHSIHPGNLSHRQGQVLYALAGTDCFAILLFRLRVLPIALHIAEHAPLALHLINHSFFITGCTHDFSSFSFTTSCTSTPYSLHCWSKYSGVKIFHVEPRLRR